MKRPRSLPLAVALLVLVLAPAGSFGQTVQLPAGRQMPTQILPAPRLDDEKPVGKEATPSGPTPWLVWIAYAGFEPRSEPDLRSKPVFGVLQNRGFPYLDRCCALMTYQANDGHEYLLVGKPSDDLKSVRQVLGWVPKDYLVESVRPQPSPGSTVPKKALIINDITKASTLFDKDKGFQEAVTTLKAPVQPQTPEQQAALRGKQYALFNIFWVYATTPIQSTGGSENDENTWLLIGSAPAITINAKDHSDDAAAIIEGWIPQSRAQLWLTREGVAWDQAATLPGAAPRRTARGAVFNSPEDAYAAFYPDDFQRLLGKKAPAKVDTAIDETFIPYGEYLAALAASDPTAAPAEAPPNEGEVSKGYKPHHMRFPNLKAPDRAPATPSKFPKTAHNNELLLIGGIGGTTGPTSEQNADYRQRLDDLGRLVETTEVLFVIDDTTSMGPYFEAVAKTVEVIEAEARALDASSRQESGGQAKGPAIRAAVAFYNDTDGLPAGKKPYTTMPLRPVAEFGRSIADTVRNHKAGGGGSSPREMVFNGITHAINDAFFSDYSRKLVVVIGDMGDHSDENDPVPADALGRLFSPGSDAPRELIAIQVVSPNRSGDAAAFATQMGRVASYLNDHRGSSKRTLAQSFPLGDQDLSTVLAQGYASLRADAQRLRAEIDQLRKGEVLPSQLGSDTRNIIKSTLKGVIDIDERLERGGQLEAFRQGYVWRFAKEQEGRAKQVRDVVLLNAAEIQYLVQTLQPVVNARQAGPGRTQALKTGLRGLIVTLVGEQNSKENLPFTKVLFYRMALNAQHGLLKITPSSGQTAIPLQDIEDIFVRVKRLEDILQDKERDWVESTVTDGKQTLTIYQPGTAVRKRKRWFTIPGGTTPYYWLDVETEIP